MGRFVWRWQQLGQNIPKPAALVECSLSAVVSTYQKRTGDRGMGGQGLLMHLASEGRAVNAHVSL